MHPDQQTQVLQRIHALAGASNEIRQSLADQQWSAATVARWRADRQRIDTKCVAAQQQARQLGVRPPVIAMAWLAGHRELSWPDTGPTDPAHTLRFNLTAELIGEAGQLHNMAAVAAARLHQLADPDRHDQVDASGTTQFIRNMTAVSTQVAAIGDLVTPSQAQWNSLWNPTLEQRLHYLTPFLGPERDQALSWAWDEYAQTTIEADAGLVTSTLENLSATTSSDRVVPSSPTLIMRVLRAAAHVRPVIRTPPAPGSAADAVSAVLPEDTARGWNPGPEPSGTSEPTTGAPEPEIEP
ncbi:hypothetical protein K7711_36510 [Nocardia sp. CA2R105]|uniref:hypothetical protein n=1 Tax=Nocardia coffeae TaxID=2873381 RepID=UPI001CA69E8F|nr:hypothetical protein [Nocardia coffeae]MBY8862027.1 hypothetical protein [Nocardia coffeae]